ncbi:hypothetical protein [Streptomyces nitrosporeus]|uniref:hypothetical protein n=1 Tax=Streptomyces nitrosporeus TaxID=28894 RepID=UPI0039A1C6EB
MAVVAGNAATLHAFLPLLLIAFVEVARVVLPEMTERGDGAFLMAIGYPAARPVAGRSGPTAVMAAARNRVHTLNGEVADAGVYAGTSPSAP